VVVVSALSASPTRWWRSRNWPKKARRPSRRELKALLERTSSSRPPSRREPRARAADVPRVRELVGLVHALAVLREVSPARVMPCWHQANW